MVELRKRKKSVEEVAEGIVKEIRSPRPSPIVQSGVFVSSGCTMLNLALSDSPYHGYRLGTVVHIIGDTHVGKSLLALTLMAEAAINPALKSYDLVYEEPESAMFFPIGEMFGEETASRLRFIPTEKERKKGPRTVQQWHDDLVDGAAPFVWVTDSFDALTSQDDMKQDSPTKGGWHTEKAGVASQLFPKIVSKIEALKSLFLWISQTRDNIGVTFGPNKTFNGGNAVKFYRSYAIWLANVGDIKDLIRGKDRIVGAKVRVKITKNKFTGKVREIDFPVYYAFGVDDVGSMVDWMVAEKYWEEEKTEKKKTGKIATEDPFIDGRRKDIIKHIEENDLEGKLKEVVGECWQELEKEIKPDRKRRY